MPITEQLSDVISKEIVSKTVKENDKKIGQVINDLKNAGLIKLPTYSLPQVDTIGKTYYSLINKHE